MACDGVGCLTVKHYLSHKERYYMRNVMWRYLFLNYQTNKITNMSKTLEEKADEYALKVKEYMSNRNDRRLGFKAGYKACQKEYEEKFKWIPIEEKLPEMNQTYPFSQNVLVKDINGDIEISSYDHFDKDWSYLNGKITHWRYFL